MPAANGGGYAIAVDSWVRSLPSPRPAGRDRSHVSGKTLAAALVYDLSCLTVAEIPSWVPSACGRQHSASALNSP